MIGIRRASERGHTQIDWLQSWHSFSFGDYHDPEHVSFGSLRVINEDIVRPASGFDTHGHRDMEIVTYILSGALEHRDSLGNGSVIRPGDIQRMSAGTGVRHSEFNPSADEPVHLLQIWILPEAKNLEPGYEQRLFEREEKLNTLRLIASRDGRDGSLTIHQDVDLHACALDIGEAVSIDGVGARRVFVQVVAGDIDVNGETLGAGDGARIRGSETVAIAAQSDAEFLLFNLA